ncbi:MAG: T9SS type A sorting domain-containing protein [Bacteroidales bacterium]|nr:T9SS type A sorting domain-containing protein [Bacteroidales bacterium]
MKKLLLIIKVAFFVLILFSVKVVNAQVIDENNGWNGDVITSIGETGSDFYAQSFYADVNTITKFGVVIREIEAEGQVILSIAADNGFGAPDVSAPLYQGTLKNPTVTGTWFYETGINIFVTVGQKYWVLIDGYNNPGATGRSGIGCSANFTDTGEGLFYSNNAGSSWSSIPSIPLAIYVEGIKQATIDENNGWNTFVVSSIGETGSDFYAQSFYASIDMITRFGVVITEISPEGQVILSIAADNGFGAPDVSAPLYQGTIKNPSTTGSWFFETGLNIPVTVGQKYWVLIDGYDNPGATGRSAIGLSSNFTDTGEGMIFSNSAGSSWSSIPTFPLAIYVEGINAAIVSENNGFNNNLVSAIGETGSDFYAQSFYANVDAITDFGVVIREIGLEGNILLAITGDNGSGFPDVTAPLYQGRMLNPSTSDGWFFETGINVPVTVGTKYWVLIDGYNNPGATGRSAIGLSSNFTNTGEGMLYSNSGGVGSWSSIYSMPLALFIDGTLATLLLHDTIIEDNESACFDATGTIIVGGVTSPVEFLTGSSVNLIAGNSIFLEPGFHAYEGSNVHAYIISNSQYCNKASGSEAFSNLYKNSIVNSTIPSTDDQYKDQKLKIYPNPNNGIFTVVIADFEGPANIIISNMLGEVVSQTYNINVDVTQFDLSHFKQGLYIIRVNDGKSTVTQKMLIQ